MDMNRREFIGAAAVAAAGGVATLSAAEPSECVNTFPVLSGREFKGLEGAIAPIFTPYGKDGAVNGDMVGRMVEFLIGKGVSGFYVGGGTGEHVLLSVDERKYLAESVISAVSGRVKTIIHVGCTYTEDSVALAKHAEKAGADFVKTSTGYGSAGCTIEDLKALFDSYSDRVCMEAPHSEDYDYMLWFEDGRPDSYRYLITDEGVHLTYHRYTPEDYAEIFSNN